MSKLGLTDPGSPAAHTNQALLWRPGASVNEVAATATMVTVGYKTHAVLRHAAAAAQLNVPRLFAEILMQIQTGQTEAAASDVEATKLEGALDDAAAGRESQ